MNESNIQRDFLGKTVKFAFNYRNYRWYISIPDIIAVLANPSQPSSYWGHLRDRYLKEGIDIAENVRLIDIMSLNGVIHQHKALTLVNAIQLIRLLNMENSQNLIDWIKEQNRELLDIKNDLILKQTIMNYLEKGLTSTEIIEKTKNYLNQVMIRNK